MKQTLQVAFMILHALNLPTFMPTYPRKPLANFSSPGFTRHNIVPKCTMRLSP